MKEKEINMTPQEKAMRQQQILEEKRRSKAAKSEEEDRKGRIGNNHAIPVPSPVKKEKKQDQKAVATSLESELAKTVAEISNEEHKQQVEIEQSETKIFSPIHPEEYSTFSVSKWFVTICWLKIPFIGFIYAVVIALSKKTPADKKNIAKAYLLYRTLIWILAATILYVLFRVGVNYIDTVLSYVK